MFIEIFRKSEYERNLLSLAEVRFVLHLENRNSKSSTIILQANGFILSLCSPVLHRMVCGDFIESKKKKIDIYDVDGKSFGMVLDMWCGNVSFTEMELGAVIALTSVADRFQITDVALALENIVREKLSVHTCVHVLNWSCEFGMRCLEEKAWELATERFEQLAKAEGFLWMDEEMLGKLLDDDRLITRNEEAVWEAVACWINASRRCCPTRRCKGWIKAGCTQGRALVKKIRFPLMKEEYLRTRVVGMAPAEDAEWMEGIVEEALRAKAAIESFKFDLLERKALDPRLGLMLDGNRYISGQSLAGHRDNVIALANCAGQICSGSLDSSIRVWSKMGGDSRTIWPRLLVPVGTHDIVFSLTAWKGRLISGHGNGQLRVWNVMTGECYQVLEGHVRRVWALAICGSRLTSGSEDKSIKVWATGEDGLWVCERTLLGHTSWVHSLAGWQGMVLSGSEDKSVRVWDVGTGTHEATLTGHDGGVLGLAVCGNRLFSASRDGTIRVWRLGTWEALRTVEACERGAYLRCLVVSGSRLFSGSQAYNLQREVRVWDLETLDLQHTLPMNDGVWALLVAEGCVWAGVDCFVKVWGQGGRPAVGQK